jgi:valyl-tRNA synthetase
MSKSLGTGMNPLGLIEAYGADATRYGLMKMASAQDVRFAEGAIEEGRKLANKLWNVSRLILLASEGAAPDERPRTLEEHWILARLSQTQREVERLLGEFDFSHLVDELYHLTFDDFCDWYAESIKPRLYDGDADARATAVAALERLLKLLHPAMPHVTEEIWTSLPERKTRLILAAWPEAGSDFHAEALTELKDLAATFRRSGVLPKGLDAERQRIFDAVVRPEQQKVNGNVEAERERLRKEIERAEKQLANERFVANAPAKVVEAEREKLARYRRELDAISD